MSLAEAHEQHAKADPNRAMVLVYETDDGYTTEWDGRTFTASNPFGLDSMLEGHVPSPRNLYLIDFKETS